MNAIYDIRAAFSRLNDLMGEFVPEERQTDSASKDFCVVLEAVEELKNSRADNTTLRQKLEQAEARCAKLENKVERMRQAGNRVISYGAKHSEWLMAIDPTRSADTWLLRKQAEAMEESAEEIKGSDRYQKAEFKRGMATAYGYVTGCAQRLRQQATEIESGGSDD